MADPQPLSRRAILIAPAVWTAAAAVGPWAAAAAPADGKLAEEKPAEGKPVAAPAEPAPGGAAPSGTVGYETATLRGKVVWQLDALMTRVDFVSIGSNDLMQFLFACDRGAVHMANSYDTLSPVMLRVVRSVIEKANAYGVEVSFCGEMARKPLDALALVGVGVRSLSVSASAIGPLKAMIRSLTLSELEKYMDYLLQSSDPSVRNWLQAYAFDHGITV